MHLILSLFMNYAIILLILFYKSHNKVWNYVYYQLKSLRLRESNFLTNKQWVNGEGSVPMLVLFFFEFFPTFSLLSYHCQGTFIWFPPLETSVIKAFHRNCPSQDFNSVSVKGWHLSVYVWTIWSHLSSIILFCSSTEHLQSPSCCFPWMTNAFSVLFHVSILPNLY